MQVTIIAPVPEPLELRMTIFFRFTEERPHYMTGLLNQLNQMRRRQQYERASALKILDWRAGVDYIMVREDPLTMRKVRYVRMLFGGPLPILKQWERANLLIEEERGGNEVWIEYGINLPRPGGGVSGA